VRHLQGFRISRLPNYKPKAIAIPTPTGPKALLDTIRGRSFGVEAPVISWRNPMPSRTSCFPGSLSNRTHCLYTRSHSSFQPDYVRILKEVLLIRYRTCVSLPRVYGFAGGRSLFQFDRSTLKRLAIARAMSSCTSKMSFSSRSNRSHQRW